MFYCEQTGFTTVAQRWCFDSNSLAQSKNPVNILNIWIRDLQQKPFRQSTMVKYDWLNQLDITARIRLSRPALFEIARRKAHCYNLVTHSITTCRQNTQQKLQHLLVPTARPQHTAKTHQNPWNRSNNFIKRTWTHKNALDFSRTH